MTLPKLVENFLDKSMKVKLAFWIGTVGLVTFVWWQYFYKSVNKEFFELTEQVDGLQTKITQEQRLARDLRKYREEVKDLDVKLKFALQELPDKKEIDSFLNSISTVAQDAGLDVKLFKPRGEIKKDFYAEYPVSISVIGSYHQVATFFDEVGRLSRIVNINQIGLHHPEIGETEASISVDCTATTFRFLDESERGKQEEAGAAKGKKRKKG